MAAEIKGITIELNGDTSNLQKALKEVRKEANSFDKELSYIDKALKFDPKNVDLLKQKIAVLSDATEKGEKNIEQMKKALADMKAAGVDETSAEYRELQREIIKAESKQKDYNAELRKLKAETSALGQASQKMADFGNAATKAGQALAGVSAAAAGIDAALIGLAYKSGQTADELNTLSKVTGISAAELQKYKAAADLVDVSVETISKSQIKLKKNMATAASGTGAAAEAFKTLGVAVTDSNGELRSQDEVFTEAIQALGLMSNETERDALAMQIFGKSAAELNPLIEDNGETYKRVAEIFANNGLDIVDDETLQRANDFNDAIDEVKATFGAAINTIGMQLAGYLAPAMEQIAAVIEKVAGWLSQLSPEALTIIGIIAGVVAGLAPLLIIVGKLSLAISSIMGLMSTLGLSFTAIAGPIGIAIAAIAAIIAIGVLLYKNWDVIKEKAAQLKDWVVQKWTALKEGVVNTINSLKERVLYYWEALKLGMSIIMDAISSKVKAVWDGVKNAIQNPIQTAVNFVKNALDKIKGFFSGLKLQLPHIKLPHFSLQGEFSLVPPSVPKISIDWWKEGGIFTKPTLLNGFNGVGEAGAEAVLPLKKLWEEMGKRFDNTGNVVINVYATPGMDVNELADRVQNRLVALQRQKAKAF